MKTIILLSLGLLACVGCKTDDSSGPPNITQGAVQLHLKKEVTKKAEVLEKFGSPNITTRDGQGLEVWTYQRHASVSNSSSNHATIILLGGSSSRLEQSTRTMTLIIKFNSSDIVTDFNSMSSSF